MPGHMELSGLIEAGMIGLSDAASRFDSVEQIAFSSYAKHRIQGSILDELRRRANRPSRQLAGFPNQAAFVHKIPTRNEYSSLS